MLTIFPRTRATGAEPLNAACPHCGDALWLHTEKGCLALRVVGGSAQSPELARCECASSLQELTS